MKVGDVLHAHLVVVEGLEEPAAGGADGQSCVVVLSGDDLHDGP